MMATTDETLMQTAEDAFGHLHLEMLRTVDVHIGRLHRKLGKTVGRHIATVRNVGMRLDIQPVWQVDVIARPEPKPA